MASQQDDLRNRGLNGFVPTDEFGAPVDVTADHPATGYVPVTKANADLAGGACRALLVGTAGTANLRQPDGTDRANVPLQQGYNPLGCLQVRTGGTADNIWALY